MSAIIQTKTFTVVSCYLCGVDFAMSDDLHSRRRSDGRSFWCTNGHEQHFTETDAQRLAKVQRQLQDARTLQTHLRDQRDAAERSASAYKGQVTRIKKRVGNGVCPCCKRSFVNLQRHMAGQHPNFADSETTAEAVK